MNWKCDIYLRYSQLSFNEIQYRDEYRLNFKHKKCETQSKGGWLFFVFVLCFAQENMSEYHWYWITQEKTLFLAQCLWIRSNENHWSVAKLHILPAGAREGRRYPTLLAIKVGKLPPFEQSTYLAVIFFLMAYRWVFYTWASVCKV